MEHPDAQSPAASGTRADRSLGSAFTVGGADYEALRPSYPDEAVRWLTEALPARADVVDVGAGTGKLTRPLVAAGHRVTAVDPSADMLAQLERALPDVSTVIGTGESFPAPDASADLIVYAQAWHWVEPEAAGAQARRVLRPGGRLAMVWNVVDDRVPWQRRMMDVVGRPPAEHEARQMYESPALPTGFENAETYDLTWTRKMSPRTVAALRTTHSAYLAASPSEQARMRAEVAQVLALEHPGLGPDEELELRYRTYCVRATRA